MNDPAAPTCGRPCRSASLIVLVLTPTDLAVDIPTPSFCHVPAAPTLDPPPSIKTVAKPVYPALVSA